MKKNLICPLLVEIILWAFSFWRMLSRIKKWIKWKWRKSKWNYEPWKSVIVHFQDVREIKWNHDFVRFPKVESSMLSLDSSSQHVNNFSRSLVGESLSLSMSIPITFAPNNSNSDPFCDIFLFPSYVSHATIPLNYGKFSEGIKFTVYSYRKVQKARSSIETSEQ